MPNRILREGINSSARVNALSSGADLFYRRLMSVVDDYGRHHGAVETLRSACWPTNPEKVSVREVKKWLNELLKGDDPLVKAYYVDGATYIEIQNFRQIIRSKSKFPEPPWTADCRQIDDNLRADCNQVANNPPQNASTRRSAICEVRNTEAKATTAADSVDGSIGPPPAEAKSPLAPVAKHPDHPETERAVQSLYPATDGFFVEKLMAAVYQRSIGMGFAVSAVTDEMVAEAVLDCGKKTKHKSAGLFLTTVPVCVVNWLKNGMPATHGREPPVSERTLKAMELEGAVNRRLKLVEPR